MNSCVIALFAVVAVAVASNPFAGLSKEEITTKTWVVLTAGSDGYYNYRHQADVCHAYQAIHKMGVPDERIIVMMKDDIVNNTLNPKKGTLINEPGGPDVYAGVPKDYTGSLVNSDTWVKLVTGEDMTGIGSGKSLKSGPDDNVFIFFDDHGSETAMCFPRTCDINAAKMQNILTTMSQKKLFKRLVLYVETCFSGSVFYKLVLPENVYVTTAAPVGASSFAYNWDDTIRSYVADIYSFLWIHDLEVNGKTGKHSFQDNFDYIQKNIQGYSQTCQYGSKKMESMTLTEFFKPTTVPAVGSSEKAQPIKITDAVSAFDVPLMTAKRIFMAEPTDKNLKELNKQISIKKAVDNMASAIVEAAKPNAPHLSMAPCTTCDMNCNCYKYCVDEYSAEHCKFECCNEESCYQDPPKANYDPEKHDDCVHQLASEFLSRCGNDHPYLRKAELSFRRVCRQSDVNVEAALAEIRAQCVDFNIEAF